MARGGALPSQGWADRVERLARIIPGVGAYQDREGLREADKRVRTYVADLLVRVAEDLEPAQRALADDGPLERLPVVERLSGLLATLADRIRFASYGFSGVFAGRKIGARELQALHDFDLRLVQMIPALQGRIQAVAQSAAAGDFPDLVRSAEASLRELGGQLEERDKVARSL